MRSAANAKPVLLVTCFALLVPNWSCAPTTPIRRTAIVPAAELPSRAGSPLDQGEIRIAVEANPIVHTGSVDLVASPGDPGLLIPETQIGASIYAAPTRWIEIGLQARYSNYDWMVANLPGVLPFLESRDLWLYGFGARLNFGLGDSPVTFSAILEYNLAVIYQARFLWTGQDQPSNGAQTADLYGGYEYDGTQSEHFGLPAFFIQGTMRLHEMFSAYILGGVGRNVTNIGFDPDIGNRYESTLEGYPLGIVGIGVELRLRPVFTDLAFYIPLESEEMISFGPSLALQVGVSLNKD